MLKSKCVLSVFLSAILFAGISAKDGVPKVDITADYQDGKINCDSLICPNTTTNCIYTEKNSAYNQTIVIVTKECLDINGQTLAIQNSTFVDPTGDSYDIVISSGKGVSIGRNDYDFNNINKDIKNMQDQAKKEFQKTVYNIKKELANIQRWLHM